MSRENKSSSAGVRRPGDVQAPARCAHLRRDPRGYPIIAAIPQQPEEENFGALSENRKLALATYDLCAVCARPFRDELRWQVSFSDRPYSTGETSIFNEAPVHEVCALYSSQVCPFVSSPYARLGDEWRKGQQRPDALVLAGFDRTAAVFGEESQLQPGEGVLMFEMSELRRTHELTDAQDARDAYEAALSHEEPIALDDPEKLLIDIMCAPTPEGEDSGGVMAGAAWFIGAAFCPQIRRVQGMKKFSEAKDDFYFQLAAKFLFKPDLMADWSADDPSTHAATQWFTTREHPPAVLKQWRADGARRVRDVAGRRPRLSGSSSDKPRDEAAIRQRKDAEAARRKARRKK